MEGKGGIEEGAGEVDLREVIEKRKSVRVFGDREVSDELIAEILQLARRAPSAGGLRAYRAIVTEEKLTNVSSPVSIVMCALPEVSAKRYGDRGNLYSVQDATIFGAYVQLIAVDLGLSSVWIGAFREGRVKRALGLEEERPVAIIHLGYRKES
jgi:nitroreductase